MHDHDPLQTVLDRLDGVRRSGRGYIARCPAHDDRTPSLSVAAGHDRRVLLRCMAGCPTGEVLPALGLSMADLFADEGNRGQRQTPRSQRPFGKFVSISKHIGRELLLPEASIDLLPHARHWHDSGKSMVAGLATTLGVSFESLQRLRTGWANRDDLLNLRTRCEGSGAFTFPMFDADRHVVGVRLRFEDGQKRSVTGSRNGPMVPADLSAAPDALVVCEGPTDCAALLTLGLPAVAVPDCNAGGRRSLAVLIRTVACLRPGQVLVLADRDAPGWRGAEATASTLAAACQLTVRVSAVPDPHKDARDWLRGGATATDVLTLLKMSAPREEVSHVN